ncbi:MAG: glycoside hydrolase family 38 C-terminal domain-containing protein, partial [Streptosporangiaceae bacterium]
SGSSAGAWITPQTRDMNPVYTGKDVSYIDTKQAQRAIETAVSEGERLATVAWLAGAPFPHAALDKAWRLLAYGAHHDGITGVESDQVYLDLLGGWREAWELGSGARRDAVAFLSGSGGPTEAGSGEPAQAGLPVRVFNGLARPRAQMATVTVPIPQDGTRWIELRDDAGHPVPALAEGVRSREDGSLAEVTLTFLARAVPALGYQLYRVVPADGPGTATGWQEVSAGAIENGRYLVTADPARGGTVSVTDKRTGSSVLAGSGNELVIQDEYAQHPKHGEGPWHLAPKGPGTGSSSVPAAVRAERCPAGSRLVASFILDGLEVIQETVLWEDAERVEFRTHVDGYREKDRLLRVRFPADVPGGLPVYQTATAVVGRSFGAVDVDSADHWYTLDNPAHQWFGLGSTARVLTGASGGTVQAIGVAEVICPDSQDSGLREVIRDLMVALAAAGVTATCGQAGGSRYGGIDADSNLPDVRIAVGGPDVNAFTTEVLAAAGPGYALAGGRVWVPAARSRAEAFAPSADVRGTSDLPVLIVAGGGPRGGSGGSSPPGQQSELAAAVTALAEDLADALVEGLGDTAPAAGEAPLADRSVALLNRGTPSGVVTPDGTLHMSLMRSCSGWPSRIWIDGDPRTAPDGSSFAWQHWSHTFEYALASGPGDWRAAGLQASAEAYNHDLIAVAGDFAEGRTTGGGDLLSVEPASVTVSAVKPRGNPLASERSPAGGAAAGGEAEVTVRLRETSGRPATARVRLAQPVSAAWLTDLLEEADGAALPVADGAVIVDMPAFGTVTLVLRTGSRGPGDGGQAAVEPVHPVYARYWLHGKGPAPAGNLPVAVHFSPTRVALAEPGQAGLLTLTVGCGHEPASGTVDLVLPDGISVTSEPDLRYELAPGGYAAWDLTVRAAPGTGPGRYFAAARIRDEHGHVIEDTAMVAVGERRWPDPALPPEEALEVMQADFIAAAAEMELAVLTPELRLMPGSRDEVQVSVTSQLASEAHGEAQLVSPYGIWDLVSPPAQGFSVTAREPAVLRFGVTVPATTRPGTRSWALVKVMYFGRVRYSQAIPITIVAG